MEWQVYDKLRPFGCERDDYLTAHICQVLANINRGKNKPAHKLKDFLLFREIKEAPKKQSTEELKKVLMSLVSPKERKKKDVPDNRRAGRKTKT